jgi:hypothetical protein
MSLERFPVQSDTPSSIKGWSARAFVFLAIMFWRPTGCFPDCDGRPDGRDSVGRAVLMVEDSE